MGSWWKDFIVAPIVARCRSWNKRWTGSLRARFKVLIKRSRSVGHFCVSLFSLFGVYAVAPGLQCGVPGGVGDVGDDDGPGRVKGPRKTRGWGRRGEKLSLSLHCPSTAAIIAEWITSSHPGSHALFLSPLPSSFVVSSSVLSFSIFFLFSISYATRALFPSSTSDILYPLRAATPPFVTFSSGSPLPSLAQFDASPIYSATSVAVPLVAVWY